LLTTSLLRFKNHDKKTVNKVNYKRNFIQWGAPSPT
jgi:hypothetical protein